MTFSPEQCALLGEFLANLALVILAVSTVEPLFHAGSSKVRHRAVGAFVAGDLLVAALWGV